MKWASGAGAATAIFAAASLSANAAPSAPGGLSHPPPAECKPGTFFATDAELEACRALAKRDPAKAGTAFATLCEMLHGQFRYDEALQACDRAIALNPRLADAWANRGKLFDSTYDFDRAIADFDRAVALDKKPLFELLTRGEAYTHMGDYQQFADPRAANAAYDHAVADGLRVQALARTFPPAKQTLASVIHNFAGTAIEEAKGAKARLTKREKPADPNHWCAGQDLPKDMPPQFGDSYNIEIACTALIRSGHLSNAELGEAYFHRARAGDQENEGIEEQWRGPMAIPDYEKAISLGADVPEASFSIGSIYAEYGEGEKAIPYLDTAIAAQGPHLEEALAARAQAHAEAGHYDQAMADVARATAIKPADPDALLGRSMAYVVHGQYALALADCSTAAKAQGLYILNARAFGVCGNAHLLEKDYAAAIADYDNAQKSAPLVAPEIVYARGVAKFKMGDISGAQADINQAVGRETDVAERSAKMGIAP